MSRSTWKKAMVADGLLSGLRSKSSGSLVVQTGFPTSLADLIVKNHSRLRKSSGKDNKKSSSSSGVPRCPALECRSAAPEIENPSFADRSTDAGSGFRFLVGNLILLTALVIGKKKLVVGITISAFVLLILEFCAFRCWRFLKPCPVARNRLDSVIRSFDLGGRECASPIREVAVGFRADSSVSDGKCEESDIPNRRSELFMQSHDLAKVCRKGTLGSSGDSKAKKLLKKFMLKKFRGAGEEGRISHCVEATKEELCEKDLLGKQEEEGNNGDEIRSFKTCYDDLGDGEDTYRIHRNVDGNKMGRCYEFVFFLIVLCGLVKGKAIALLLALAWCFLYKLIEAVGSKGKMG